ncbi:MAG: efflux RND transporter periplasmic adaptor subunit [Pseudomonadota bacterium]
MIGDCKLIRNSTPRSGISMRHFLWLALLTTTTAVQGQISAPILVLEASSGYEATRRYAGETVPGRATELGFKQAGQVSEVLVDVGSRVTVGEPLARLDARTLKAQLATADADIAVAKAAVQAAGAQLLLARNNERRLHRLRETGHTPQQLYDEAKLALDVKLADRQVAKAQLARVIASRNMAQIALSEAVIYAPFPGTIQSRYLDEGTQILPGQAALRLVATDQVEVHVGIPSKIAATLLTTGRIEQADKNYQVLWQGRELTARLRSVLPEIDATTRTQKAVFTVTANDLPLGAVVELTLANFVSQPGFWVPLAALVESERGLWGAYVIAEDNTAQRRLVEIIHNNGEQVFVRGTLQAGERLIRDGVHRIVPGQAVTPAGMEVAHAR